MNPSPIKVGLAEQSEMRGLEILWEITWKCSFITEKLFQSEFLRIKMILSGDTYSDYRPQWLKPILWSSPLTAVRILPLLQDVLLGFKVCLLIAHPASKTSKTLSISVSLLLVACKPKKRWCQWSPNICLFKYLQTTEYLHRTNCRKCRLLHVCSASLLLQQVVDFTVQL